MTGVKTVLVSAVGLIDADNRVLIAKRPEGKAMAGLWEFPGGKVEEGETPGVACARELREELGIEVEVGAPVARVEHAYSHFRITMHAFRCRLVAGDPVSETGEPIAWAPIDALDDYAFPRANRRVIEVLIDEARAPRLL